MLLQESETLELKTSTSELKEAVISICAILNKHQRGELYFGIKNNETAAGMEISEKTIRDISRAIAEHLEPKVYPVITRLAVAAKQCLKLEFSGQTMPYFAYGRAYIRVGDEDRKLSAKELENIILEKHRKNLAWDTEPLKKAGLADLSAAKLKKFVAIAGLNYKSPENSLEKLGLLAEKHLLNTAVLLFGKDPVKFFPNAKLRCAVFGGNDTAVIIDRQEYTGDIFYLIEQAQDYILKNIHLGMQVQGLYREDIPEIDKEAFREAIINAFCHRDYREYDAVSIAVFKDRVEIRSPGGLYGGLTIAQIKKASVSRRRNELLAEMFYRIHFVEKWGRGIPLILGKEPAARFKEIAGLFITVFPRKSAAKQTDPLQKTAQKTAQKILTLIQGNNSITTKELAAGLSLSVRTIAYTLQGLKKSGLLARIGGDKGGRWKVL
ncbi:MAG: putative DNA binding domain-containing protein [Candidatus Margulisbacteria bacterium]|jgi:ATP-dependent DNA helicase RecG|nr:putative DNA binding domain-containing protein [Candidatus Margulisiibacteriota bacterium]